MGLNRRRENERIIIPLGRHATIAWQLYSFLGHDYGVKFDPGVPQYAEQPRQGAGYRVVWISGQEVRSKEMKMTSEGWQKISLF